MPDIFRLQGVIDVDAGKAESTLKRVDVSVKRTHATMNATGGSAKKAGSEIAGGFDRGLSSAHKLGSFIGSLQSKLSAMRGASLKFGASGGSGGSGGGMGSIGAIAGGNLLAGAVSSAVGAIGGEMKDAVMTGIEYNKFLESATVRMSQFFKTGQETDAFVSSIEKFAGVSPVFDMRSATTGAQRLLQMKFAASQVVPMLNNIGDAIAATGGGADDINAVTTQMSQMVGKGKLLSEDLQIIAEHGIPVWNLLAKAAGKSEKEMRKAVESGGVDARRGVEGIIAMMGEQYKGQSIKAAGTLAGSEAQAQAAFEMQAGRATKGISLQAKSGYQKVATGLSGPGGNALASQLDQEMTKIGSGLTAKLDQFASGEYLLNAAKTVNATGSAIDKTHGIAKSSGLLESSKNTTATLEQMLFGDVDKIQDPVDRFVLGALKSAAQKMGIIGGEGGQSFATGMAGAADAAKAAGATVAGSAEQGVRDKLDQHSPSQVMLKLGSQAAGSFATGFMNGKKAIQPISAEDLYKKFGDKAEEVKKTMTATFGKASADNFARKGIGFAPGFYTSGNQETDAAIQANAKRTGVPGELLFAQQFRESRFNPNAKSYVGALGPAQFMPPTAKRFGLDDPTNRTDATRAQADYMKFMFGKFGKYDNKEHLALAGYNAGENRKTLEAGRVPRIPETLGYIKEISAVTAAIRSGGEVAAQAAPATTMLSSALNYVGVKMDAVTSSAKQLGYSLGVISEQKASHVSTARLEPRIKSVSTARLEPRIKPGDGASAKPFIGGVTYGGGVTIKAAPDKLSLPSIPPIVGSIPAALPKSLPIADTTGLAAKAMDAFTMSAGKMAPSANDASGALIDTTSKVGTFADMLGTAGEKAQKATDHFEKFRDTLSDGIDTFIESGFKADSLKDFGKGLLKSISSGLISQATGGKANSIGSLVSGALTGKLGGGAGNLAASLPGGFAGGANPAAAAVNAATGGGSGGGVSGIASKAVDAISGGKGIGGLASKAGGWLSKVPGLSKLGGLFGGGAGAAGGAAGAAAGAGGILGKISGALGFAGPWGMIAGIGLQFAAPLLGKLFGGDPFKDYKKFIQSEYGVKVESKSLLSKVQQLGQSKFGAEWQKRKIETVKLPETRDMVNEYAAAKGLKGGKNLFSGAEVGDQYSAMNQIKVGMREFGGPVNAGGAYIVGERRPELFIPRTSGTILPSVPGNGGGQSDGGSMQHIEALMDVVGDLAAQVARIKAVDPGSVVEFGLAQRPDAATNAVEQSFRTRSESSRKIRDHISYR